MKVFTLKVIENKKMSSNFALLTLNSKIKLPKILPGQFVSIYLPSDSHIVPRPFSIFSFTTNSITVFYKILGCGTEIISKIKKEEFLKVLLPLGNNFPRVSTSNLFLIAGGIGIAPMYCYLNYLKYNKFDKFNTIKLFYGAKQKDELYFIQELKTFGINLFLSTDDGSLGDKCNVIDSFLKNNIYNVNDITVFSCGPKKMLESLFNICKNKSIQCYLSLEENMGCGFGACVGCVTKTSIDKNNNIPYKLVCKDGPIFKIDELEW